MDRFPIPSRLLLAQLLCLFVVLLFIDGSIKQFAFDKAEQETFRSLELRAHLLEEKVVEALGAGDVKVLSSLLEKAGKHGPTRYTVIAPDGRVLVDTAESPLRMENHAGRPEIAAALQGRLGCTRHFSHTLQTDMLYCAIPLMRGREPLGVLRAAEAAPAGLAPFAGVRGGLIMGGLALAVALSVPVYYCQRRFLRWVYTIQEGIKRFASGDFSQRIPGSGCKDCYGLSQSLNRMAETLDGRIRGAVQEKNQLDALFARMVEGVIALDRGERIFRINHAAVRFLGLENRRDSVGRNILEVVRNIEMLDLVRETLGNRFPMEREIAATIEIGAIYLQVHGVPILDEFDQVQGALIVMHDVTGIRKLENVRRDFVANVSHELKTPITSIKGFVETLLGGAMEDAEDCRRFLEIIDRQAERLSEIVDDLLALSRLEVDEEAGEIPRENARIDEVLQLAVQACLGKATVKSIRVRRQCPETLTAFINPPLLEQVVVNLVDNAVKYSDPGSEVLLIAREEAGKVLIEVQDQGPGIPREHLPRLFERFYRVDKARGRKLGGSGLGLSIVKHIVQAHGGQVQVESELGRGSVFTVTLPRQEDVEGEPA